MGDNAVRAAFMRQPFHFLVIDVGSLPETALNNICCALSEVLAIASSIRGSCRIPALGLMAISKYPNCLMPLKSVRGNYANFASALNELQTLSCRDDTSTPDAQPGANCIRQCLQAIMSQFIHFSDWQIGNSHANDLKYLQITFITLQRMNGVQLSKQMEEILSTVELAKVKKIQVVNIEGSSIPNGALLLDSESHKSPSMSGSNNSETHSTGTLSGMIDVINVSQNIFELESFFKIWLHDHSTDKEHLIIKLPNDSNGKLVSLLCDIHEQLLNPGAFVFSSYFYINIDPLVSNELLATPVKQTMASHLPVIELEAVKLVQLSGVCESIVFGMPLRLQPTSCWRIEWSELETNRQYFQAVSQLLKARDSILVTSMKQSHQLSPMKRNTMNIYFGIFASDTALLIKSLATKEFLLPPLDSQIEGDYLSDDIKEVVDTSLHKLQTVEQYNPVYFPSGLCSSLKLCLCDTKPFKQNQMKHSKYSSMPKANNLCGLTAKFTSQNTRGLKKF